MSFNSISTMAKAYKFMYAVTAVCFISSLVGAYSRSENDQKWNQADTHSQSYFGQVSRVAKVAQQRQYIESANIQEELDKISETFSSLSSAFSKQTHRKHPTFLTGRDGAANTIDFQKMLMSAVETLAAEADSPSTCANDTASFLTGLINREAWAIQFLDSFGKPGPGLTLYRFNFVGNYDQCRAVISNTSRQFHGNYCTLKMSLGAASTLGLLNINLGACMPDTCSVSELTLLVEEALYLLGLNGTLGAGQAECHTDEREMTTATVLSIAVLVIIGVMMVIGTGFDIIFVQLPKWKASSEKEGLLTNGHIPHVVGYSAIGDENREPNNETMSLLGKANLRTYDNGPMGVCSKVLLSFSVYTNGSKVLNTSQPPGSLSAIHGIRFLSMSWVVLGHLFVFGLQQVENFISEFPLLLKRWTFDAVSNAFASVDTFFTLSGLLTAYLTLTEMKKRGWKINWPLFFFHRFWRLTPPYMLTLLLVLGLQQYLGSGALWSTVQPSDKANCENYWWANLLYVNNLVDAEKMCFGHSWYLANDMQFFLLSPLMFVPFYFNVFIGLASCVSFLLISWITTGVLSSQNGWPTTLVSVKSQAGNGDLITEWFEDYYTKPWCRIGAYVVGVLAGYYLATNNGKIKMRWYTAWLGWIVAIATGLAVVYGLHGDISGDSISSVGAAALYNAVARSAWGACVCWVIIACVSGYGGFVNSILSWSPFVVLGRFTYMSYLIHPTIIALYFQNQERLYYITDTTIIVSFCGLIVITNMAAFVLMLAFESPWIGLERTFIRKKQID